jgi:hypothetical protein
VAGFFEALDGMRTDIAGAACDEDVHEQRFTLNEVDRIGEIT